ncbi:MAG: hypothetical protein GYB21_17315 [Oceanospirillales bacterium]|nr:hypothetical protein [Oceanospirillales bacterium]
MRLLLMRHCEAEPGADSDPDRRLLPRAIERLNANINVERQMLDDVEYVLASPWLRARETAQVLVEGIGPAFTPETLLSEALLPTAPVEGVLEILERCAAMDPQAMLAVGHQPLIGRLISYLCEGSCEAAFSPAPGEMAVIELDWPAAGLGSLRRWCQF